MSAVSGNSGEYIQERKELLRILKNRGVTDAGILDAIVKVPRHLFLNPELNLQSEAYRDVALPIGEGQTISQPYTVAYQTGLLEVKPGDKILEIGTGSGYQAAILSELGAQVYSIERQRKLYDHTSTLLSQLGYSNIRLYHLDGNFGLPEEAPFDKILITAAAPGIPQYLVDQIKVGGLMVVPVNGSLQKMCTVLKISPTEYKVQEFDDFKFVPLLSGTRD